MKPVTTVQTMGRTGNIVFQYSYARLIAEKNKHNLVVKAPIELPEFDIYDGSYLYPEYNKGEIYSGITSPTFQIHENAPYCYILGTDLSRCNINIFAYCEDYTIYNYGDNYEKVRSWYPKKEVTNFDDLGVHIRLGDFKQIGCVCPVEAYLNTLKNLKFRKLYLISDDSSGPYFEHFKQWDYEIVHHDHYWEDFNFLRSFNNIMFGNSTFGWWASYLSDADKKYVYRPWQAEFGNPRNLGETNFPGWNGYLRNGEIIKNG